MEYIRKNGNAQVEIKGKHFAMKLEIEELFQAKKTITIHNAFVVREDLAEIKTWIGELCDDLLAIDRAAIKIQSEYEDEYLKNLLGGQNAV